MKIVKKYLLFSVILTVYVFGISLLLKQFYIFQQAYLSLSKLIAHPSVEIIQEYNIEGE